MYSKKVLERFQHPKFSGEIPDADGVGEVGNMKCGDIMRVYIKVEKKRGNEIIKDIKFLTYGCVAAVASSDVLCEIAKGKTLDEALKITSKDIVNAMGGEVPAIKVHCSVLAQNALKKAIEEYKKKK